MVQLHDGLEVLPAAQRNARWTAEPDQSIASCVHALRYEHRVLSEADSMESSAALNLIQADYDAYPAAVAGLQQAYLQYPRNVSIETQVKCNAKCGFCPYPTSPRRGQEMPDERFEKLIADLSAIPHSHPFAITLHRINEPLLDRRMQRFSRLVADRLPSASQQFWSNGTMLKEGGFEWMGEYPRASLSISLNSMDEDEHVQLMGLSLAPVLRGLDYLHTLVESGKFTLPVTLCAPYKSHASANRYLTSSRARWPLFTPAVRPFFEWMGASHAGSEHRIEFGLPSPKAHRATTFACAQWFDLHVLASGYVTKCCIDETGHDGDPAFDTAQHDVLTIYRNTLAQRMNLPARSTIAGCEGCKHLG